MPRAIHGEPYRIFQAGKPGDSIAVAGSPSIVCVFANIRRQARRRAASAEGRSVLEQIVVGFHDLARLAIHQHGVIAHADPGEA